MASFDFSDLTIRIIKLSFNSRFKLARLCKRIPTLSKIVERLFFEGDDILVLPRDNIVKSKKSAEIEINTSLPVSSENMVLPSQILKEMIKKSKYRVIMNFCICRTSNSCNSYPREYGCIFLGRGARRISTKIGRSVTLDEALEYVDICQNAGLVHIIGRNKIDSVWLNTGPKEELLSICNCCPCCCLWKMIPDLPEQISERISPMPGVELVFNKDLCTGCGECAQNICFVDAISIKMGKWNQDIEKCRCCGRCVERCPHNALSIIISSDAHDRSLKHIKPLVDIEAD